jgi:hypothetical protein
MENLTIADIIKSAFEGKPADAQTAFNSAIQDKMAAALDSKRYEIAQSMYGDPEEDSEVDADDDYEDTDLDNLDLEDQPDEDV